MLYEKERELAQLSIQKWASDEVFSYQWFILLGVLIVSYAVWLMLADRKRGTELLLTGALETVAKAVPVINSFLWITGTQRRLLEKSEIA